MPENSNINSEKDIPVADSIRKDEVGIKTDRIEIEVDETGKEENNNVKKMADVSKKGKQLKDKTNIVFERHRHRYEVNNLYIGKLEKAGLIVSGTSPDGKLVEAIELKNHPFFVATQFHPEYISRPLCPHPIFLAFVEAIKKRK